MENLDEFWSDWDWHETTMMIKHVQIMLIYLAFFELYYNEFRDRLLDTLIYMRTLEWKDFVAFCVGRH